MAVTIAAAVQGDKSVLITLGTVTAAGYATVTRSDGVIVRSFNAKSVAIGTNTAYDYEPPQNTALTYSVVIRNLAGSTLESAGPVTAAAEVDWSADRIYALTPVNTGLNVNIVKAPDRERDIVRDVVRVIGRTDPLVTSDVRQSWSGSLEVVTLTSADATTLRSILATGQPIALAQQYQTYPLSPVEYFSVGKVSEKPASRLATSAAVTIQWVLEVDSITAPPLMS